MKILFIADSLATFKIYKDTTFAMMTALSKRKVVLFHCLADDLMVVDNTVCTTARPVTMTPHELSWFQYQEEAKSYALTDFDAVMMRSDPPFDLQYLYATHLLTLAAKNGARIFNSGLAMREGNEKLAILNYPQWIAPTIVATKTNIILDFLTTHGDIIIKPLDGMGGMGIFRLRTGDPNIGSILETLSRNEQRTLMAQRFIPEIKQGDKRILIIGGKVVPYALARIPKAGETRGNLAAGGRGVAQPLSARDLAIASAIAPDLKQQGVLVAGLDVIGDYLTEINITSPTGFQEITQQTDVNVAEFFADALDQALGDTL